MTDIAAREYTTDEMMTVAAARELEDGTVCFVGHRLAE
jgi:acyl CoA:acetate/3-ketoacid CoA transferase beta subunit